MQDRNFIQIENQELREEYFENLKKIFYVFELSSVLSYYLSEYKTSIDAEDYAKQEKIKNTIMTILKPSGINEIEDEATKDPSFSYKILSLLLNNVLFNYTNFLIKNAKSDEIKNGSADEEILELLLSENSEGEDPNKVFDLVYNKKVSKGKLKA